MGLFKTQEVEALFHGDGCPPFLDCVFAHNDSWYVTFSNEEEAHRAYLYLRETVRTFQGKPIMVSSFMLADATVAMTLSADFVAHSSFSSDLLVTYSTMQTCFG